MELSLSPYNFIIFSGVSRKGKPYRVAKLSDDVAFNDIFVDRLIAQGVKVVNLQDLKKSR